MKKIIDILVSLMIVLSSGAFIQLLKDGGAREQGLDNATSYSGFLNVLPMIWLVSVTLAAVLLLIERRVKRFRFDVVAVSLLTLCLSSFLWSDFPVVSARVALFIAASHLLISMQVSLYGGNAALRTFSHAMLVICVSSLVFVLLIPSYGIGVGEHEGKWQGVFSHKNGLGNFACLALLVFMWRHRQTANNFWLLGAAVAAALIVGSQSGTAMANAALLLTLLAVLKFRLVRAFAFRTRYLLLLVLLLVSALLVFTSIGNQEIAIFDKDSSFSNRNLVWIYMLSKIGGSPVIGFGLDQIGALNMADSANFFNAVGFVVGSAHNGFIETLFSIGVAGLFAVVLLMVKILRCEEPAVFDLMLAFIVAFVTVNTFESMMVGFNVYTVALFLMLAVSQNRLGTAGRARVERQREGSVVSSGRGRML